MAERYAELVWQVLREHFPEGSARVILHRAEEKSGTGLHGLTTGELPRLIEALKECARWAARSEEHARRFRADLDLLQRRELSTSVLRPSSVSTIHVRTEQDISTARLCVRRLAESLGGQQLGVVKVTTVVSELARNLVSYADGGGTIDLIPMHRPARICVRAIDSGPGISQATLEQIQSGTYRSRTGLGRGIVGSKRLSVHFDIQSSKEGTRVEAEVEL